MMLFLFSIFCLLPLSISKLKNWWVLWTVPTYIVGESEFEASKEGRSLSDFKYACVGYSVFLDNKDNPGERQEKQAELPFCVGIEVIILINLFLLKWSYQ